ncbi:hypothetical protein OTK49_01335 [Vibrio coralliirubri]|uniref:hypothetical protein n=1 Tax=Vibrio coralliirubri TaxID=1516159 RepID=UPI002284CEB9|nr:hypothetical protein [Vibrio coralliirubri]MCY9861172.1 hypothetical protein [Vibrio coralliirubri]
MEIKLMAVLPIVISYGLIAALAFFFFRKGKRGVGAEGNFTFKAIMSLFWYSLGVITSILLAALVPMIPQHYDNAVKTMAEYDETGRELESLIENGVVAEKTQNQKTQVHD